MDAAGRKWKGHEMNDDRKLLLRPGEVAEAIGCSRAKAYELIAKKEIPAIKIGNSLRVPVTALQKWIDEQLAASIAAASAERQ
jgi:excisionase family DNA binding protein